MRVSLTSDEAGGVLLTVADDGAGLPADAEQRSNGIRGKSKVGSAEGRAPNRVPMVSAGSANPVATSVQASSVPRADGPPLVYWNRGYRRLDLHEAE